MDTKKQILILDDDIQNPHYLFDRLKSKYAVDSMGFMNTAEYKLKKPENYCLAVVCIKMPSRRRFSPEETADGRKTGIIFYEKVLKPLKIPTILWSWGDEYEDEIKSWNDPLVRFLRKEGDDRDHLLREVDEFLLALSKGV